MPVLFLMHPRVLLALLATKTHCWLLENVLSPRIQRAIPQWSFPGSTSAQGYSSPHTGPCIHLCWVPGDSFLMISPPCRGPSEGLHGPLGYWSLIPALCHDWTHREDICEFVQVIGEVKQYGTSTELWGHHQWQTSRETAILITTPWDLPFSWFLIHFTVHSSNPHFLSFPMRMLWETVPKALLKSR